MKVSDLLLGSCFLTIHRAYVNAGLYVFPTLIREMILNFTICVNGLYQIDGFPTPYLGRCFLTIIVNGLYDIEGFPTPYWGDVS